MISVFTITKEIIKNVFVLKPNRSNFTTILLFNCIIVLLNIIIILFRQRQFSFNYYTMYLFRH